MSAAAVIVARAPRAGEVKTRLAPLLGAEGCARLQAALIGHTAAWVAASGLRCWLAYTPADAAGELRRLVGRRIALLEQAAGDLGMRLRGVTRRIAAEHAGPLVVLGADAPLLGPAHLQGALGALGSGRDVCLIPALDGGYVLIALRRPLVEPFAIPPSAWGGPRVLKLTLDACRRAGLSVAQLDPVADLDTPEDALRLRVDPSCPPAIAWALDCARRAA